VRLIIDDEAGFVETEGRRLPFGSKEAFALVARAYVRSGWANRYSYGFSWMGRPIIQLPDDMIRLQEAIWAVKPDLVIETGVAHGGSLIYTASLLEMLGKGRVVGVDIVIRPQNRAAIEAHPLSTRIQLLEGSSTDPEIVAEVRKIASNAERVMVILDSDHRRSHVHAELLAYAPLVTHGSWIVATDGIMGDLADVAGRPEWTWDNPEEAAREFLAEHPEFELAPPDRPFDETSGVEPITYWPGAWLRRT
jgi:cephalosporin hydroxylase